MFARFSQWLGKGKKRTGKNRNDFPAGCHTPAACESLEGRRLLASAVAEVDLGLASTASQDVNELRALGQMTAGRRLYKIGTVGGAMMVLGVCMLACAGPRRPLNQDRVMKPDQEDVQRNIHCAMMTLFLGMIAEDSAVIRAFLYAENDPTGALVEAQTQRILWNIRLLRSISKLADTHDSPLHADLNAFNSDDFAFSMLAGDWTVAGPTATIPPEGRMGGKSQPPPPPLIDRRGIWKVNLTPEPVPASTEALAHAVRQYTDVLEQTVKKITAGELDDIEEINKALKSAPRFAESEYMPPLILTQPRVETKGRKRDH